MPKHPKRKDPLDEPDDLLASEDAEEPWEDEGPEPEPTPLDDDLELGDPSVADDPSGNDDEPRGSPLDDEDGLLGEVPTAAPKIDEDEESIVGTVFSDDEDDLLAPDSGPDEGADESLPDEGDGSEWEEPIVDEEMVGLTDADWAELEDEGQTLAPGRVVVGYKEFVSFPDEELIDLVAMCDTGQPHSLLYALTEPLSPGKVRLTMGDRVMEARGGDEDGHLVVRARLSLGGASRRLAFRVINKDSEIPVVLGRDALEGFFVVDVALGYIHKRER